MNEVQKKALKRIEDQLYGINARNISLRWIGMRQKPTEKEISDLNQMLAFIIQEIRTLRETGSMDVDKVYAECFGKQKEI